MNTTPVITVTITMSNHRTIHHAVTDQDGWAEIRVEIEAKPKTWSLELISEFKLTEWSLMDSTDSIVNFENTLHGYKCLNTVMFEQHLSE